jgi:hypothetical protein
MPKPRSALWLTTMTTVFLVGHPPLDRLRPARYKSFG